MAMLAASACVLGMAGCGGGGGSMGTAPVTMVLKVNSTNPASGVSITASPADNAGTAKGSTSFELTYNAGTVVTLTAPATSGSNGFQSWAGCNAVSGKTCTVTMTNNATTTANYGPPAAPVVTVTPGSLSITTLQGLTVGVVVKGTPAPTGTVTFTCGSYSSAATTLAAGSASVVVPAGALALGSDVIQATYAPDAAGAVYYLAASGSSAAVSVVTPAATTVTVDEGTPGIPVSEQLLGMNLAAWGDPTLPAIATSFEAAGIKAVRWPGGSWSDDYHWAGNTLCGGGAPDGNATFQNFVSHVVTPARLDVALTANYGTDIACSGPGDPTEAAAWAAEAVTLNANVSRMTVGNEEYGSWETDLHALPHDAMTYSNATANGYYPDIKAAAPNMLVGVVVNPGNSPAWDPIVLANAKYDFVEFHFYPQGPGSESDAYLVSKAPQDLTSAINTVKTELATAGKAGTPIYVGETGSVYSNPGKQTMSITQGLFAGQVLGELMNDGVSRLTWWIGFANCNGTAGNDSSSLYGWQNFGGYNVFADGPTDTGCAGAGAIGTMSPTARAFQLFSQVAVKGEKVLGATVTGDTTDVHAYAATHSGGGGTALVLFNLNQNLSQPVTVALSGKSSATSVTVTTYSKAIYDETNAATPVWAAPTTTSLGAQGLPLTLTLDPWSMNVVVVQ